MAHQSPPCCRPKKMYEGARLEAVNKAFAIAAHQHVSNERWGLGSPSLDHVGTEVARFRRLKHTVKPAWPKKPSTRTRPTSSASSPSEEQEDESSDEDAHTLEWRARFTLVEPHPGLYRYRVTDDWSNSEALIRATPRLHKMVADALVSRLASIFGGRAEPSPRDDPWEKGGIRKLNYKASRHLLLRQSSTLTC